MYVHTLILSSAFSHLFMSSPTYVFPAFTGKLAARAQKVAHFMLRKLGSGRAVKPGDRVALVFRPDEAPSFVSAFYGCIIAAVIPVCIEPPITKEVSLFVGG